jgi:hypothetical protein
MDQITQIKMICRKQTACKECPFIEEVLRENKWTLRCKFKEDPDLWNESSILKILKKEKAI